MGYKKYIHKKTGKEYELISDNFMLKDVEWEQFLPSGDKCKPYKTYKWRKGLILYKALYDNPDGPFFSRTKEDFFENFEEVIEDEK